MFRNVNKPAGKRLLGSSRHRWEDNIRIYIKGIGINTRNWLGSTENRIYWRVLVNVALNLWVYKPLSQK